MPDTWRPEPDDVVLLAAVADGRVRQAPGAIMPTCDGRLMSLDDHDRLARLAEHGLIRRCCGSSGPRLSPRPWELTRNGAEALTELGGTAGSVVATLHRLLNVPGEANTYGGWDYRAGDRVVRVYAEGGTLRVAALGGGGRPDVDLRVARPSEWPADIVAAFVRSLLTVGG